jgi:hypothetical protein
MPTIHHQPLSSGELLTVHGIIFSRVILTIAALTVLFASPCPAKQTFPLARRQAGPVKIGMPVDELIQHFGRNNTRLVDRKLRGRFTPGIEISIRGNTVDGPSLIAEFSWWREIGWGVSRVIVLDPRFVTAEGAGVGTPYGALQHAHPVKLVGPGEGIGSYAYLDSMDMAFSFPALAKRFTTPSNALPDDVRASQVVVQGTPEFLEAARARELKKRAR